MKMVDPINEFFGKTVFVYTSEQGIEDGILMKNPLDTFAECNLLTKNLWAYIQNRCSRNLLRTPHDLLECLMKLAKDIYDNGKFDGNNYKNFFVIKGNDKVRDVWFVRNEHNKLTGMLADDY
jgi:hypothetical protein